MVKRDFRTYHRRDVTRKSGFKASGETTGGECKIKESKQISFYKEGSLIYKRDSIVVKKLFKRDIGIIAFGAYILNLFDTKLKITLSFELNGKKITSKSDYQELLNGKWNNVGFHHELQITKDTIVKNVQLTVDFVGKFEGNAIYICCDNLDAITYDYFINNDVYEIFKQKTALSIPHIYYLSTDQEYLKYLYNTNNLTISNGISVVLKSCNRCKRYLPVNMDEETYTLAFTLHCKKRAPCIHHNFHDYRIVERDDNAKSKYERDGVVYSHYGHQLECKACKKFFVNAPLNWQRNPQQHKEDSLRRRAFEVLVDSLLNKNFIHFDFESKTKKQFSEFIYNKFRGRCFKCGKKITLKDMNLDHTMPLAYLYRLDETATCLCATHNASKNDHFPVEYYSEPELKKLSQITGLTLKVLHSKSVNMKVVNILKKPKNVVWFFDEFLADKDYQKIRDGILTADKIYAALVRVLPKNIDLIAIYKSQKNLLPKTINIK